MLLISSFECDDEMFLKAYPFAEIKPLTYLLHAIQRNHPEKQRTSRNGSSSEHDSLPDDM
jgi:hypothetical protein